MAIPASQWRQVVKHYYSILLSVATPLALNIDIHSIKADFILLSHGHGDHVADAIQIANNTGATCIAAAEIAYWLQAKGINNVHAMNHGGAVPVDFGTLRCVNAVHSSSLPDGSYGGNPLGFVITTATGNFTTVATLP